MITLNASLLYRRVSKDLDYVHYYSVSTKDISQKIHFTHQFLSGFEI